MGLAPSSTRSARSASRNAGRAKTRYHAKAVSTVKEHLEVLQYATVCQVGDLAVEPGEPLLMRIFDEPSGRTTGYAPARLVAGALFSNYLRVPRVAGRLDAEDSPFALGIAAVVRDQAMRMLEKKTKVEAPITTWLDASGEDWREEASKRGTAYWTKMRARLVEVAGEATFGSMQAFGSGRDTVLALDVESELRESYEPLLEAKKKHQKAERRALVESKRKPARGSRG